MKGFQSSQKTQDLWLGMYKMNQQGEQTSWSERIGKPEIREIL